jgi:hypothetical protein
MVIALEVTPAVVPSTAKSTKYGISFDNLYINYMS